MRFVSSFVVAVTVGVFAACGGGDGTGPGGSTGGGGGGVNTQCPANTVCMRSSTFSPTSLTVSAGTVVTFSNNSGVGHNVAFDGTRPPGVTDIPLNTSGDFPKTFSTAGTYDFHCDQHAGMQGRIVVN